jgi:hypothetical protein
MLILKLYANEGYDSFFQNFNQQDEQQQQQQQILSSGNVQHSPKTLVKKQGNFLFFFAKFMF